jgi:hypothetical protein
LTDLCANGILCVRRMFALRSVFRYAADLLQE